MKAAEHSGTSPEVVQASMAVSEYKEDLVEAKKDLAKSKELVKDAQMKVETALNRKQRREALEELSSAKRTRAQEQRQVDKVKSAIDGANREKLSALRNAPIESKDDDEILQSKKDAYSSQAQAELELHHFKKQLVDAPNRYQQEVVQQRIKDASLRKKEAQIKLERAYEEEEKSDETSDLASKMDANKIKWEVSEAPDP